LIVFCIKEYDDDNDDDDDLATGSCWYSVSLRGYEHTATSAESSANRQRSSIHS